MNKTIVIFTTFFALLIFPIFAQDLSIVTVADQFDSGARGGNLDLGGAGSFDGDWSDETISNTNGVNGTIIYRNAFAGQYSKTGEEESPVLGVTTSNLSPDRSITIAGVATNTRPGATSPSSAIFIGDDGGYNALAFGDKSSCTNYFLSVDVFLPDHSGESGAGGSNFTRMGISVRNLYIDEPAIDGPGWLQHTQGSYALIYESSVTTIFAVKVLPQSTGNDLRNTSFLDSNATTIQIIGTQQVTGSGWHTFRINAVGSLIQFLVDGTMIAQFLDADYPFGAAVLYYRASGTFDAAAATDTQGRFDNLIAGPHTLPTALDKRLWMFFE